MTEDFINIPAGKLTVSGLLSLIDKALLQRVPVHVPKKLLSQKTTKADILKWIKKHKIIQIVETEPIVKPKRNLRSRKTRIELTVQLKALGLDNTSIAKKFKVKVNTVKSYISEIGKHNQDFLNVLATILELKKITSRSNLNEFPVFPVRINKRDLDSHLKKINPKLLSQYKENEWIKVVTGKELGTADISLLFPE